MEYPPFHKGGENRLIFPLSYTKVFTHSSLDGKSSYDSLVYHRAELAVFPAFVERIRDGFPIQLGGFLEP